MGRHSQDGRVPEHHPGRRDPFERSSAWHRRRPLGEQLARAAVVQRSLLPDVSLPVGEFRLASLYWPCDALGGDIYDLARRPDCGVLLAADVMGHGVEAALITMLVKAAFQDAAASVSDPGELLADMSARLRRIVPPNRTFIATLVVKLDLHGPGLQLANAGLPHPFVLRGAERRLDEVRLDGVPLGLADDIGCDAFQAGRLELMPGDVLLIASDGLGSVEGRRGDYFEDRRLRQALENLVGCGGDRVIARLAAEARLFGHGRRLPDDVNLVAIWRPGDDGGASGEPVVEPARTSVN